MHMQKKMDYCLWRHQQRYKFCQRLYRIYILNNVFFPALPNGSLKIYNFQNANNVNEIFLAIARKLPRDSDGAGAGGAGSDGGRRLTAGQNGAQEGNKSCCNR